MFENERNKFNNYNDDNRYVDTYAEPSGEDGTGDNNNSASRDTGSFVNGAYSQSGGTHDNVNSYEWGQSNSQFSGQNSYHSGKINPKKDKKTVSRGAVAILLVLCIAVSAVLGIGGGVASYFFLSASDSVGSREGLTINTSSSTGGSESSGDGAVLSTEEISNKVADSVVEIITETVSYSYFYGQAVSEGAGSGVIIDENGYVITNNHVIEGAKTIKITLRNGNEYEAKLIGSDSDQDIALIKFEPKSSEKLTVATFGDSDKLAVGDKAVAIGNPLGELGGTVTDGIISALDREVAIEDKPMNLLQTDAAINPGNSGGGLFDGQGNLIGIVVAKASGSSSSESVEGLGFAIPINDARSILGDLKKYGYVQGKPAQIGVVLQDYMDMVYVYAVTENSAADKAGFKEGDKIMKVGNTEVKSSSDVKNAVTKSKAGDKLKFQIERNGETKHLTVTVQEATKNESVSEQTTSYDYFNGDNGGNSIWDNYGY